MGSTGLAPTPNPRVDDEIDNCCSWRRASLWILDILDKQSPGCGVVVVDWMCWLAERLDRVRLGPTSPREGGNAAERHAFVNGGTARRTVSGGWMGGPRRQRQ